MTGVLAHASKGTQFQIRSSRMLISKLTYYIFFAATNNNNIMTEEQSKNFTDTKLANRQKYEKKGNSKRRNAKELRRIAANIRVRRRNAIIVAKNANNSISPHGLEDTDTNSIPKFFGEFGWIEPTLEESSQSLDETDSVNKPPQQTSQDRNDLVREAVATPPQDKTDLSGEEHGVLPDLLKSIQDLTSDSTDDVEEWVSHLENLVVMAYQVSQAKTFTDVFVAVIAYIKMNTKKSVIRQILNIIDEISQMPKEDITPQAWTSTDVLQKWDLFKTNTVFTKISFLISAAMSLSVCSIKQIEWSPFGLKLIAIEAAKEQLKAVDVIDAVIRTFTWIAETGYRVIKEKSLAPLLYSNNVTKQFNEECDYVLANAEQAIAGNLGCINDFEHKLDKVLRQVCELKQACDKGPTALWLQKRYSELVNIKHKVVAKHRNTALREAPIGFGITGPSGVGKSTLSKLTMKTSLNAMGFDTDPRRIVTKDMYDAYDSNYTSDTLGLYIDDVGNGKSQFAPVSPTDIIIKFFNNMAAQAVKAELNAKGVVFIAFKVGVITSNFADYNVRQYSEKPEASLRRFYHARTRIKPKYRKEGSVSLNTNHPDLVGCQLTKDVWEIDIEECHIFETKGGKDDYCFRILTVELLDGTKLECRNLSLCEYLDAVIALSRKHHAIQEGIMKRTKDFDDTQMCKECYRPQPLCKCTIKEHSMDAIADAVVSSAQRSVKKYINGWLAPVNMLNTLLGYSPVRKMATHQLQKEMSHVINGTATPFLVSITPEWLFKTSVFQRSVTIWQRSAAAYDLRRQSRFFSIIGTGALGVCLAKRSKSIFALCLGAQWGLGMFYWSNYRARIKHYESEYISRRDALPVFAKSVRDSTALKGAFAATTLIVGLKMFQMWNTQRIATKKSLSPDGITNVDDQPSWFGFMMQKLRATVETSPIMKHSTPQQLTECFRKNNLFWATFQRDDGTVSRCNIFFPRKSVAFFPKHVFYPGFDPKRMASRYLTVTVHRGENKAGDVFKFKCELSSSIVSDKHDLVSVYVPNCPDLKNRVYMLPLSKPKGISQCNIIVRKEGEFLQDKVAVTHGETGHRNADFYGGTYKTRLAQNGACMGMLILQAKSPAVVGFHIGGDTSTQTGVMQTVTQSEAQHLIDSLEKIPGVILSANAVDIPKEQYGVKLIDKTEVHPHCMASKLNASNYVEVLGSTKLRSQMRSSVQTSIISEIVTEECGVPNEWGPPPIIPNWKGFNATLEHIANPSDMFLPSKLERARKDWLEPLIPLMVQHLQSEDFRPLNDEEIVLGIPGKRFLDPIPMTTSMGFPVFGPKNKHFNEVRDGEMLVSRKPDESVRAEMRRLYESWDKGERAYPVMSATLKDEPTPIGKEKVRVFQAAPVAFGLFIRKYFLPIARFLSLHPLESESAVGVNAFSYQWEELMNHACKYAESNEVLAWDYSKYDVRMNSQLTRAALCCFIELAEIGGYNKQDLKIMRNMVVDLVHPMIDYNGTMLHLFNINTSGNNITVNINGTVGSLYVRLGFFDAYPNAKNFRDNVSAMTYGDDFTGSIKPEYNGFNFISYKAFLAEHDIKITLPNKSDDEVAFMQSEDADFIKRQSNFIPEIGCSIGKLCEDSIFKSLHANIRSKTELPEQVSSSCIETAMHEWFAHGKEVYTMRQQQMRRVCERANLPVPAVNISFQERVDHWLEKYSSKSV